MHKALRSLSQHHINLIEWYVPDPSSREVDAEVSSIEGPSQLFPFITVNLKNVVVSGCSDSSVRQHWGNCSPSNPAHPSSPSCSYSTHRSPIRGKGDPDRRRHCPCFLETPRWPRDSGDTLHHPVCFQEGLDCGRVAGPSPRR